MYRSYIAGLGMYVPPKIVTNDDLAKIMTTSDEWITQRTGIKERHFIEGEVPTSYLAYEATLNALKDAKLEVKEIDFIVLATLSPERSFPGTSCFLQERLGIPEIGALDIRTQCSGFIYGLSIADQYIKSGMYKNILVVGVEIHSTGVEFNDRGRDLAVLFGDGAGAAIVSRTEEKDRGVLSTHLHSDGRFAKDLWIEYPSTMKHPQLQNWMVEEGLFYPKMNGKRVFVAAVTKMPETLREAVEANNYKLSDVDLFVVHQANLRIIQAVANSLEQPLEKFFVNIHKYGNTTAASIPIALTEAKQEEKISPGKLIALASFGAGFTWGSALIRW